MTRIVAAAVCLFCLGAVSLYPDVPVREEQLVYSILAFTGRDYSKTFCIEESDTIYLLADQDNMLTLRKALVYFWPVTGKWNFDTQVLNKPYTGTMEIGRGDEVVIESTLTDYVLYSRDNSYDLSWYMQTGEDARAVYGEYQDASAAYWEAMTEYEYKKRLIEAAKRELAGEIMELRDKGENVDEFLKQLNRLTPGDPPESPEIYAVPPAELFQGYHMQLSAGDYWIRFRDSNGFIVEGSEKSVIVRGKTGVSSVGYEIIPGDKWTRAVESANPSDVIYVDGSTELYLQCYYQDRYNDLFHQKVLDNNGKGNPGIFKWVRTRQIPGAVLEVEIGKGDMRQIHEEPFIVEQTKGGALGYTIVPYNPDGDHKGEEPNIIAFHIPLGTDLRKVVLRAVDSEAEYIPYGSREIRVVDGNKKNIPLFFAALVPLVVMIGFFICRRRLAVKRYNSDQ